MKKNLILMSALFAGSMIVNSGFGANLERNSTKREHDTELETQNDQVKRPCLDYDDETFKSSLPEELNAFITSNKLANLQVDDLLRTAVDIKKGYNPFKNLQSQEKKLIFNKILSVITNRDFKFDNRDSLENLIIAYHNDSTAIELITPDRLSNININDLLETAVGIKAGDYPFEILQDQTKKLILDKIFNVFSDKNFKFEHDSSLSTFISTYYDNTNVINIVISDRISDICTNYLIETAADIKNGYYAPFEILQDQNRKLILNEIFTTLKNKDFKFYDNLISLSNFIKVYHEYKGAMDLITGDRLSPISTLDLLSIAANIKNGWEHFSNLQEQEKEQILNKILNILKNRDFKFENRRSLESFIWAYHDNIKSIALITSNRVSNINTNTLLSIAEDIKRGWLCFSNLQEQEKESILNKILDILTNRNFKLDTQCGLETFICAYHDNVEAIDLITLDRIPNISTNNLLSIAANIKRGWDNFSNLQEQEKELIRNKILNIITDRDFKFGNYWDLSSFIYAYCDNTKAMNIITSNRLSNIKTLDLIGTALDIKIEKDDFLNWQEQEKELILNKILNIITDRNFKFEHYWDLFRFIRAYYDNAKAMNIITSDSVSNVSSDELLTTAYSIKKDNVLQGQEKELILNKIFNILTNRDFKFESCDDLTTFISAYCDNTTAMGLITSDKLSNVPTEQLEISAEVLNKCLKCLPYHFNPSEKENIQRVIDIIDQKLHQISWL